MRGPWLGWGEIDETMQLDWIASNIPKGLPVPLSFKQLGSGSNGRAYETTDPEWVLKITCDPQEVDQLSFLAARAPETVCRVLRIHRVGKCWFIWKEHCTQPWKSEYTHDPDCGPLQEQIYPLLEKHFGHCPEEDYELWREDVRMANVGYNHEGNLVAFDP